MKADQRVPIETGLGGAEAELENRVRTLFGRFPELIGFAVDEALGNSLAVQLLLFPPVASENYDALSESIAAEIGEFASSRPEAIDMVRGRLFARTLH